MLRRKKQQPTYPIPSKWQIWKVETETNQITGAVRYKLYNTTTGEYLEGHSQIGPWEYTVIYTTRGEAQSEADHLNTRGAWRPVGAEDTQ